MDVDGAGNVYVADINNHAIRMLSGAWVAGSTTATSGSADAAGTSAGFANPRAVHADVAVGLLYVADYTNNRVRTITIAGNRAVATLATLPNYVVDISLNPAARVVYAAVQNSVYVVTYAGVSTLLAGDHATAGYLDSTGNAARFDFVTGVALDASAGVLYAADQHNHRIRRITTAGGVVTTVAGSGTAALASGNGAAAAFNAPTCVGMDAVNGALYIGDQLNHAIRQMVLPMPAPVTMVPPPLPPSPLAPTQQLTAWRAVGTFISGNAAPAPTALDARTATFSSPLAAANTAGLNTAIRTLLLGTVTLGSRNAALAATGNTNTTFSTSAQRGLGSLTLKTAAVPAAALVLPALTNLTLAAPTSAQQVQLTAGSLDGLSMLTCINCAGVARLVNLSSIFRLGALLTQPLNLPLITALDASGTGLAAVLENSFDGMPALRWLSIADNNLTYVSDAAFSATKQPALAIVDQSRTLLVTGGGCPSTMYLRTYNLAASGNPYSACPLCIAGAYCAGGSGAPAPCGANTYAAGGAAACARCPAGLYATGAAIDCAACPPGLAAPGCNATASWRDSITLMADGAGSWVNASVYLVPAGLQPAAANVSCNPLVMASSTSVSCTLPFLPPAAATAPVLTQLWVAHAGTGGVAQRLNVSVVLLPPPQVTLAPSGSGGLSPLMTSGGRIVLRLPSSRLTAADWTAAGLQPPPQLIIDSLAVWLAGAPCTQPAWESSITLSCAIPSTDGVDILVVVLLANLFNITGVLPSVFAPPALAVSPVDAALLPFAGAANSTINITLPGTALCVGQNARVSNARVGGLRCGSLQCVSSRTDAALCIGWNVTAAAAAGLLHYSNPTMLLNASAVWANRAIPMVACDACVELASRPVLSSITPTIIAAAGVPVVVAGTGIMGATSAPPPTVLIGGKECSGGTVLSQTVGQCNAPELLASAPGYPVVSVVVINAVGAASTELVNLTYPATFSVSWASLPALAALPGGVLTPVPTLRVLSRQAATCALAINVSSCATANPALGSRPAGMSVSTLATATAVDASGTSDAVLVGLLLDALEATGASGCTGTLTASCIDSVGLTASTVEQSNPTVALAGWRADWASTSLPAIVVPEALPHLAAVFSLVGSGGMLTAASLSSLSCLALLLPAAATPPPLSQSLDRVSSRDVLSSVSGTVALVNGSAADISFAGLTASAARMGQALALYAECTWVPTGERLRLPPLPLAVTNVSLALVPPTSLLVEAYESAGLAAAATLSPPSVATFAGADGRCSWRTIAMTSPSLMLAASSAAVMWTVNAGGAVLGEQPLALTVEGPPGASLVLQLVCSMWGGNTVVSPPLNATTHAYTVTLHDSGHTVVRTTWPTGTSMALPWVPALAVTAPARNVLTCSVSVAGATLPTARLLPGIGLGLSDATLQVVGEASVSLSLDAAATRANVSLPHVGLRAPGGTNASLAVSCRDGVGRSAALGVPINVSVATLAALWTGATVASMPAVVVPTQLLPSLTLALASTPAVPLPTNADVSSLLTCTAALVRASMALPLGTPLATLLAAAPPYASASTTTTASSGVVLGADNTTIVVTLPQLPTTSCPLATHLTVAAECTWTPTGERVRLPFLTTSTLQVTLSWAASPAIVLAYTSLPLGLAAIIGAPASNDNGAAATGTCEVLLVNATVRSTRLLADAWSITVDCSASGGTSTIPMAVNVTVQAPQATQLYVQALCTVWGQVLVTPPLRLTTASLETRILSALPSTFIASDASSPWPLDPPLVVAVVTRHNDAVVADASCTIATLTHAAELVLVGTSPSLTSLRSIPTNNSGIVAVPSFVVQTSTTTLAVTLVVECQHLASGDAVAPLNFTVPATLLTVELCVPPATKALVGEVLSPFSVGIAVLPPGGTHTSPCTAVQHNNLPPIACTIALNTSATTTNDTSSVFLQHTAVVVAADSHIATFDAFTLVVPQGEVYGLSLTCTVGGLAISPTLAFAVETDGCRAGQATVTITCATCDSGMFSLGGRGATCNGCPPAGATCVSGILTLLPHYFRPAAQAGQPLGPTTELHPCYNAEACTLVYSGNASGADYGCSYGYTGPLCGVCDAAVNFAQFGEACAVGWTAGAVWVFVLAAPAAVLGILTRVALRKASESSDAAIGLRITLGDLQAVGRPRGVRAGSTQAYNNVMGWTEVVSASPLSVGALQCILWLPYLFQYVATVALPVLASVAVVAILHMVTTGRSLHCRPRCRLDTAGFKAAVAAWWATKRHYSTLLFVLFLTYMPIVSASLRALDCIEPVAGIRYLRSDLRVECGVGQHAVARALAYVVLIVLGIGFPAGLAWLMGTARNEQLVDPAFHATWGFLFDGYRAPSRTLVTLPAKVADTHLIGAPKLPTDGSREEGAVDYLPSAPPGSSAATDRGQRRSSLVSDRLNQAWVVSGDSRVWWEAVVVCRKAGVVLLAVTVTNPYMQCVGATLWFAGAAVLQARYSPYARRLFNGLEMASLVATFLTAVVSTALLQFNVGVTAAELHAPDAMSSIEWAVTVLLAVINVGTFAMFAGL